MPYAEPQPLNTLAGTVVWTYRVPGETVSESELIGQMIEAGHTEDYANDVARFCRRGWWGPNEHPHTDSTSCHSVRWDSRTDTFTYIGR